MKDFFVIKKHFNPSSYFAILDSFSKVSTAILETSGMLQICIHKNILNSNKAISKI